MRDISRGDGLLSAERPGCTFKDLTDEESASQPTLDSLFNDCNYRCIGRQSAAWNPTDHCG